MFGRVSTRSASSTWSRQRRWRAIVCPQWKKFSTARWRLTLRHCGCVVAMCARCTAPLVRDGMNRRLQKSHEATLALERHKVEASHRVRVGDLNKFFDGQLVRVSSTYSRFRAELLPSYCPSAGGCNRRCSPHVRCAGGSGAGTGQHSSSPDEAHLSQGRPCCANVHPCPRPAGRGLVEVLYQANELTRSVPGHRCFAGFQLRAHQHRLGRCCVVTQCVLRQAS